MADVTTECPSADVLEGIALDPAASPEAGAHLAACSACRAALQRIRDDNQFLRDFAIGGSWPIAARAEKLHEVEISGYEIVREIHRGGQGVVYQAVQLSTKRDVAIKVMKQGPFATLADRVRFDREIETLGKLNHPNIVAVHDAGVIMGFHYFVMNYVDGETLDASIVPPVNRSKAEVAAAIRMFVKVCDAVHAAHLRGIIHRDLKPSNIRVDSRGEPHVLDFGLAKSTESPRDSAMTQTGQFVGSLPWASPEQMEGTPSRIDMRTDVYSLGAILFQLLTNALPFDVGSNVRDVFEQVMFHEPPPPSQVVAGAGGPEIDGELDTIVLKCLSKDRDRRYQSAAELARDLRRYLEGSPIEAKRDSALYVLRKTLRRYRLRVAVGGTLLAIFGVFGIVMAFLYRHSTQLEREAVRTASSLASLLTQSNIEQGRMAGMLGNLEQAEQLLWRELLTHRMGREKDSPIQLHDPPGSPEVYWSLWDLYRRFPCRRTITAPSAYLRVATVADDGRSVWTVDSQGLIQRSNEYGVRLDEYQVSFPPKLGMPSINPTGQIAFFHAGVQLVVWRRDMGDRPLIVLNSAMNEDPSGQCASRTGRRFAAVIGGDAIVWNSAPLLEVARFSGSDAAFTAVAISNDDARLAARDRHGVIYLWDIETRRLVDDTRRSGVSREVGRNIGHLLFSPDDRLLADGWAQTAGRVWHLDARPGTLVPLSGEPGTHRVQSFSPDSRLLAIGDLGGALRIFDARTGKRMSMCIAHTGRVQSVSFTGDGRGVWTCDGADLRLWDVLTEAASRVVQIDGDSFHGADISPDGRWCVAGGGLGKLHRIEFPTLGTSSLEFDNQSTISSVAISPDGRRTAAATYGNVVYVWDAQAPDQPPATLLHPHRVSHACFNADGSRIGTGCDDGVVRVWRAADGAIEHEFAKVADRVPQVAFDPAGRHIAAAVRNGALLVWDLNNGERQTWSPVTHSPLRAVRFSPDGRWLFSGGANRTVDVWDVSSRERVARLEGHNQEIYCVEVSSDGELIATGDTGGAVRIWHSSLRCPLMTLEGHTGSVMSLRFSRDGRWLISAALDQTIRAWDLTYYDPHIKGNVARQLGQLDAEQIDGEKAGAWRRWAEGK
ncbi:MAG TPA: protein kinase [Phycisphaerae bacterium]|nr:protein kinase [Phycisphaerae bacterium]